MHTTDLNSGMVSFFFLGTVFISVTRLSRRKPSAGQGGGERPELSEALELDVSVHTLIERAQAVGGGCASHCCHAPAWLEE